MNRKGFLKNLLGLAGLAIVAPSLAEEKSTTKMGRDAETFKKLVNGPIRLGISPSPNFAIRTGPPRRCSVTYAEGLKQYGTFFGFRDDGSARVRFDGDETTVIVKRIYVPEGFRFEDVSEEAMANDPLYRPFKQGEDTWALGKKVS